ncbi:dual specificity protein phosphatase family protein [Colwellia piezophila]|uniref:phosphatase domain-containing putative toxin n=1 Tax=Colwellia piezophila TaxID=211668 RepID=UPI0003AAE41B|nr:dual specificity protein phosphatase family protein [Colwellia piezophila]
MNTHPFDILPLENGAQLIFTPCPGSKGANLADSITQLKQAGTSVLLTLMFDQEMSKNQLTKLPDICEQHKISWLQLPIIDDEAPTAVFESNWLKHKAEILSVLNNQGTIAVHCKGGTGRTGLVIALILLDLGYSYEEIISQVQKIRPKSLINSAQLDYLNSKVTAAL